MFRIAGREGEEVMRDVNFGHAMKHLFQSLSDNGAEMMGDMRCGGSSRRSKMLWESFREKLL